jgi:PHD/YefM family antitoxin component YafN of YafNO toxin-antitoxin module
MTAISANELKTRGIAAIEKALADGLEATISVRGKVRYVVMPVEQFHFLRECELESALLQTRADLAAGRTVRESPEAHVERLNTEA